jgi:hypothetical protein
MQCFCSYLFLREKINFSWARDNTLGVSLFMSWSRPDWSGLEAPTAEGQSLAPALRSLKGSKHKLVEKMTSRMDRPSKHLIDVRNQ